VKGSSPDPLQGTYLIHYIQRDRGKVLKSARGINTDIEPAIFQI